ncbi:cathepsin G-like isoform X2 [Sciurus carolinensis]|uniref:cathepsin G-like isoform X2 n=1 Tax=Sciurus carolinensis TaxID=30640 RepID=UPI001FB334E5|nr:cathepsin G-like isoform X2 [Sciurus carolinensis]
MQPLLLLLAFLLPPGAEAGKIIGGREARPHSYPYMAYLRVQGSEGRHTCGGFLVREDFVMTAAHCWGSLINVTLGAHNIQRQERTQQHISVLRAIRHPDYNPWNIQNDIMLLQLSSRIRQNAAVRPVALPQAGNGGDSGGPLVCNNVAQGIVSYGANNGTPPAVFTRILSYLPWVQRTMRRFKWEDQTETPL